MKTLVEQFMEDNGYQLPPNFKRQDWEKWPAWRRGEVKNQELEEWAQDA